MSIVRFAILLAAFCGVVAGAAPAKPVTPSAGMDGMTARDAVASIRRAVGSAALERLRYGLAVTEEDGSAPILLGVRHGEVRQGGEVAFDGSVFWHFDERRRAGVPLNLRQFEKLAWPLWVRGGWWLNPKSGITASLVPDESDGGTVALRLKRPGGVVPATVYVDRSTWLPVRLVVPYDRGPLTILYSDWRSALGAKLPFAAEATYRGTRMSRATAVRPLTRGDAASFALPRPQGYSFDASAPAEVAVKRGTPFSDGVSSHVYAAPEVDGAAVGPFLLDSGADGMMIDEKIADALVMPVIGRTNSIGADGTPRPATFRRGRSFRIGRLLIADPVYLALDLSKNNAPPGEKRAGVIGYDVFARAAIEFAGTGDQVAICDPVRYRLPGGAAWRPLSFMDSAPAVRTRFAGGEGLFQVDTGSAASVDFYPGVGERHGLLAGLSGRELVSAGAGGSFTVRVGKLAWFEFGGRRFRDLEVSFRTSGIGRDGGSGVIGRDLMAGFTTVFDYPARRIAFLPRTAASPASMAERCR
ncbi:MAG TPA: retropepsin-like aspartic protease [Allosphingosinicella sp.]|jgi:hypothetical protein